MLAGALVVASTIRPGFAAVVAGYVFVSPLVASVGALERELGRLKAERDRATRGRDELRAENERLAGAAVACAEAPHRTDSPTPGPGALWRRICWFRDRGR